MKPGGTVHEIYSAIQGEGLYVGERHVFFRLAGCNLDCLFCDTPARARVVGACAVERNAGAGDFEMVPNPVAGSDAVQWVHRLAGGEPPADAVSFTGGEPLVQEEFVCSVAAELKARGIRYGVFK